MAHVKALNKKKITDDGPESPLHTPISGNRQPRSNADPDSDDSDAAAADGSAAATPTKSGKKKKVKQPLALTPSASSGVGSGDEAGGGNAAAGAASSSGACATSPEGATEIEIVFKLHPSMKEKAKVSAIEGIKENSTRYIKTTSKALVEHLCRYLAMRVSLDLEAAAKANNSSNPAVAGGTAAGSGDGGAGPSGVKDLAIYISPPAPGGQFVELAGSMALCEVNEKYWNVNKPMEMTYSFQRA